MRSEDRADAGGIERDRAALVGAEACAGGFAFPADQVDKFLRVPVGVCIDDARAGLAGWIGDRA